MNAPQSTDERSTRWGRVKVQSERLDGTYTRYVFEGPSSAVIAVVAERLNGTTVMYEHMFTVDAVASISNGLLRVTCTRSNYAGD